MTGSEIRDIHERGVISIDIGDEKRKQLEVYLNTGITVSYDIHHAIGGINKSLIGAKIE